MRAPAPRRSYNARDMSLHVDWSAMTDNGPLPEQRRYFEVRCVLPEATQKFLDVLRVSLPAEQGRYAVFGRFALNCYVEPRETQDIDVALISRDFEAIVEAVLAASPVAVKVRRGENQAMVFQESRKIADIVRAEANPVIDAALRDTRGTRHLWIPRFGEAWALTPEAMLATKYYSATTPERGLERRLRDSADLVALLEPGESPLDLELVRAFVARIPMPRAAEIFERFLQKVREGGAPGIIWGALDE